MSRTLAPFDPPSSRAPTILLPDHARPAPPGPPPASGPTPHRRRLVLVAACVVAVAIAIASAVLAVQARGERIDPAEYEAAVALERGVRPLVSDRVGELGTITGVVVERTPDPEPARVHLLAPEGEQRPRLSVVSETEPVDISIDGLLADGRPYEIFNAEGRYVSLGTVGADGQYVEVMGRGMAFADLLSLAAAIAVTSTSIVWLPYGWVELGSAPMPPWHHGFGTHYTFDDGRRLDIDVERATPGRAALAAFGPTEPVDLGTGGWAYRYRPPISGVLFQRGDVVVNMTGEFSDAELMIIVHSLREMAPHEHPMTAPDPYPF